LLFGIGTVKIFRRFDVQELHRAGASRSIFYLTGAVGIAATLLQLYNAALLNAFWTVFHRYRGSAHCRHVPVCADGPRAAAKPRLEAARHYKVYEAGSVS
jgi:hypothetical protein